MEEENHLHNILAEKPKRYPVNGTFELTVRCNLHCKMCLFRHDDGETPQLMAKELTAKQWIDMAEQAAKEGTGSLLITGGEPMLRPDFCEIWEGIYKQGFIMELYTNATLVTPQIMETLKKYPPHKIGITLYGASRETYQAVCGNGSAFRMAVKGARELSLLPSLIQFRTTIIKDNYCDIESMENLIHSEFGKERMLIQTRIVTKAVRGGCADAVSCRLDPEDNVNLALRRGFEQIKKCVGDTYHSENVSLKWVKQSKNTTDLKDAKPTLFGCNAGMRDYTISWDGKLLGCQMLGVFSTDVLKEGLRAAWERFPAVVYLPDQNEECRQCQRKQLCNSCAASRVAGTGKINGCPDYFCRDAKVIQKMINRGERE